MKNIPVVSIVIFLLITASGCSTLFKSKELKMPGTESEWAQVDSLVRSYEASGYSIQEAKIKALQKWYRIKTNTTEKEDSIRLFPRTSSEKRKVERLAEKYEKKGYSSAKARRKALDSWRNERTIKIR